MVKQGTKKKASNNPQFVWPDARQVKLIASQKLINEILDRLEQAEKPAGGISIFLLYYLLMHVFSHSQVKDMIKQHQGYANLLEELGVNPITINDYEQLVSMIEKIVNDDLNGSEDVTYTAINTILRSITILWGDLFVHLWGDDKKPGLFHELIAKEIVRLSQLYDSFYRVLSVYQWIFSKNWKYFFPEDIIYSQDDLFGILRGRLDERTELDENNPLSLYVILATEPETFKKIIIHKIREKIIMTIQKPLEELLIGLEESIMHSYETLIFQLQDLEARFPPVSPIIKNLIKEIRRLHKNPNKINVALIKNLKEKTSAQIQNFLKEAENEFLKVEKEFYKQLRRKPPHFNYLQFDEKTYSWKLPPIEDIFDSLKNGLELTRYLEVEDEPKKPRLLKRFLPFRKRKKGLYQQIIEMFYPYNLKFIHASYLAATLLEKDVFELFELLKASKFNTEEHLKLIIQLMKLKVDTGTEDLNSWLLEANRDVIENMLQDSLNYLRRQFFREIPLLYHAEGARRTSYIPLVDIDARWFTKTNPTDLFPKEYVFVFYDEHRHIFQIGMIPVGIERAVGSTLFEAIINHLARRLGKHYWNPIIELLEPFLVTLSPRALLNLKTCPIPYKLVDSFWTGI